MSSLHNFRDLYLEELRDLYNAEQQLVKALPRFAQAASSQDLKDAIEDHWMVTQEHVDRLAAIFDQLGEKPTGETCDAMEGLVKEGKKILAEGFLPEVCDAALIAAAQRIKHYEIAGYGAARTFARLLGDEDAAGILQQTLDEESAADRILTDLAENSINSVALQAR